MMTELLPSSPPAELSSVAVERIDLAGGGAWASLLRLDRPAEMNPIDWDLVRDLGHRLRSEANDPGTRVILITGAGEAFSAGGDMKKYQVLQRDPVAFPAFLRDFHEVMTSIKYLPLPVVALVNGVAVAGGLELLLSCDFAIASSTARIGDAHLVYGQMGGGGVLSLLPLCIGPARARELVLSGRLLSAAEAQEYGLVNRVVGPAELLDRGIAFAEDVASRSPLAVANAKYVMNATWADGHALQASLRLEREHTARYCLTSEDPHEGLTAFAEKRQPKFRGR